MEAKGIAVWQLGIGDGARGGSRPAEAGYRTNARGDESRLRRDASAHRVRRVWWEEPATHGKVLYPF